MVEANNRHHLGLALLVALLLALWVQWPHLRDPYRVENDVRNMYLIHRYEDITLFPLEEESFFLLPLGRHTFRVDPASPGYSLLLSVAAVFMPPALFTKLLVFPLTLAAAYYLYRFGEELTSRATGLALVVLFMTTNLASGTSIGLVSGLHRTFGPPLVLALLYYLYRRRYILGLVVLAAIALVYVPLLPVAGLTFVFALREEPWREWLRRRHVRAGALVVTAAIIALLFPLVAAQISNAFAGFIGLLASPRSHILFDPLYGPSGRLQLYQLFPLVGRMGVITSVELARQMMVLSFLAIFLFLINKGRLRQLPMVFRGLLWASVAGYALSWLAFLLTNSFLLYQPSRFTTTSFFVLLIMLVGINIEAGLGSLLRWLRGRGWLAVLLVTGAIVLAGLLLPSPRLAAQLSIGLRVALVSLGVALVGLFVVQRRRAQNTPSATVLDTERLLLVITLGLLPVVLLYLHLLRPLFVNPTPEERALYAYLATLPRDALIAGEPCSLDSVPFFSQRSVLLRCKQFSQQDEELAVDTLLAYYAEEEEDVVAFCREYKVDYLVLDKRSFVSAAAGQKVYFHEPYHSLVAPTIAARDNFVLATTRDDRKLFSAGDLSVVPCPTEPLATTAP